MQKISVCWLCGLNAEGIMCRVKGQTERQFQSFHAS